MPTVLVIDGDARVSTDLALALRVADDWEVLAAEGGEGLARAREADIDLLILGVTLSGPDGLEILATLRRAQCQVPVVVLHAPGAALDVVTVLESGADDVIAVPVVPAELLARCKAVLRRDALARPDRRCLRAGALTVNAVTREVRHRGEWTALTDTEFDVLRCLIAAQGRVLSREPIQSLVWGPRHRGARRTIDNVITQLRAKLEDDPSAPRHILTVRGVGYRFVA